MSDGTDYFNADTNACDCDCDECKNGRPSYFGLRPHAAQLQDPTLLASAGVYALRWLLRLGIERSWIPDSAVSFGLGVLVHTSYQDAPSVCDTMQVALRRGRNPAAFSAFVEYLARALSPEPIRPPRVEVATWPPTPQPNRPQA